MRPVAELLAHLWMSSLPTELAAADQLQLTDLIESQLDELHRSYLRPADC